jgi:flagellar biosynthetic protein FliR
MNAAALAELFDVRNWPAFALVSARVGGLMLAAPLWSLAAVPVRVRAAITVVLTATLLPLVPERQPIDSPTVGLAYMVVELLLGVSIGLAAAAFMGGVALAAEIASVQMGLSIGSILAPAQEITTPGLGELKGYFALAIYAALGGHLALLSGLGESLRALPPGAVPALEGSLAIALNTGRTILTAAVRTAAPLMAALLLAHVALAILNRAVPQINTLMVSIPITVAVGLVALGASLCVTAGLVQQWTLTLPASIAATLLHWSR